MPFHFSNSIKYTIIFRLRERNVELIDLFAFFIFPPSLFLSRTHSHTSFPLKSILIFPPTVPFCESYSHFYSVLNMRLEGCSWKFLEVKLRRRMLSSAVVQALFNKKYPLCFNGCHILQLAASTIMWSIWCFLFSLAHQVHLKAQVLSPCFKHDYILFLCFCREQGAAAVCGVNKSTQNIYHRTRSSQMLWEKCYFHA